jgi:hypothetical protein
MNPGVYFIFFLGAVDLFYFLMELFPLPNCNVSKPSSKINEKDIFTSFNVLVYLLFSMYSFAFYAN